MKMMMIIVLLLLCFEGYLIHGSEYHVHYEWKSIDYEWDSINGYDKQQYINNELYKIDNNAITGIKLSSDGTVYVTVPRWLSGVPSTLNRITDTHSKSPLLVPYPSWEAQSIGGDCTGYQNIQSMEIDNEDVMWVLDVGRIYFLDDKIDNNNNCPPKLVRYDINTNTILSSYIFPHHIASHNSSFLNDLVIDEHNGIAYISDAGTGAIVIYNVELSESRRFSDVTTQIESNVSFQTLNMSQPLTPVDGIALSPDKTRLFYCALQGLHLYSVSTQSLLSSFSNPQQNIDITSIVQKSMLNHGMKSSPSDGMTFSCDGKLWYGGLTTYNLFSYMPTAMSSANEINIVIVENKRDLTWIDTFSFYNKAQQLWFTSNKLNEFLNKSMNFDVVNFRVSSINIGSKSYLYGDCNDNGNHSSGDTELVIGLVVVIGLLVMISLLFVLLYCRIRQNNSFRSSELDERMLDN